MSNTVTSVRATLHVCHRPLTFRDVTTWDHEPERVFDTKEAFQGWVKELSKNYYEGGTYISFKVLHDTGVERFATCTYAYWNQILNLWADIFNSKETLFFKVSLFFIYIIGMIIK